MLLHLEDGKLLKKIQKDEARDARKAATRELAREVDTKSKTNYECITQVGTTLQIPPPTSRMIKPRRPGPRAGPWRDQPAYPQFGSCTSGRSTR